MAESKDIEEETQTEIVESADVIPVDEIKTVVTKEKGKKTGKLWEPLTNQKVYRIVQKLKTALLKIEGSESYRTTGKATYVGFRIGARQTFANINLSPERALCRVGRMLNGKTLWDSSFKITEDGITQDGNSIQIDEIVNLAKAFVADKEWV